MKRNKGILLTIELFTILCLILNIFVKNILNEYMIALFLLIMFSISVFLLGFEKNNNIEKKNLIKYVFFITISFLILLYGIGLFSGFVKSPYSFSIINIIKNTLPILLVVIISELLRYNISKKCDMSKIMRILIIITFTLVDINLLKYSYDMSELASLLELITIVMFPSLFKNIMLTDFSIKYGYETCLIYQIIMNCYTFLIPVFPDLGLYLQSVLMVIFPLLIKIIINGRFDKKRKKDYKSKNIFEKVIIVLISVVIGITILLYSNLFPIWIAVVGSGSMQPTINVGDLVIIDKTYQEKVDELKVGDVLVFKIKDSIYTHRIVSIKNENEQYYITTKGDREGNAVDNWIIKKNDIVGKVKFKIPYLGYPSVWLNEVLEESKNE